ncbi:hypothetical protein A2Z00_01035 [Candidatus Gottesmanbacteria bacterium RBG_13_45_10]|uniref:Triosephosphate isomerase n=1 Tax=Candidatus Gottesmanbacteria bacterium RBG_13_45_10 TaxID=1798370 RepID=A0A1F5ZGK2_9BACT|nr:MAG: hypothetical protein A2Z00_01035 [Candidatus Gottesmanbacteria bacterium RBG_13_45_10]
MKTLFIAGNWKSNKTLAEAKTWIDGFKAQSTDFHDSLGRMSVVVCAPFTALSFLHDQIALNSLPIALASQNISPFPEGAYTGEVTGRMVKEFAAWVILGHSERRKYFNETDELLKTKTDLAHKAGLNVIYCVPDAVTAVPVGVKVVAYEPVWAIGTGKTDSPQNASSVIGEIKKKTGVTTVIYGGSVTDSNVASFVSQSSIDGVLPGGASLDPIKYVSLIRAAYSTLLK